MTIVETDAVFLADFGVSAVVGEETSLVILDRPEAFAVGDVIAGDPQIRLPTSTFSSLAYGDSITVDGTEYTVRDVQIVNDGRWKVARLAEVAT